MQISAAMITPATAKNASLVRKLFLFAKASFFQLKFASPLNLAHFCRIASIKLQMIYQARVICSAVSVVDIYDTYAICTAI